MKRAMQSAMKSAMKRKREVSVGENLESANQQARSEMRSFLQALDSYPERFANDPRVSFEQYCSSLIRAAKAKPHNGK